MATHFCAGFAAPFHFHKNRYRDNLQHSKKLLLLYSFLFSFIFDYAIQNDLRIYLFLHEYTFDEIIFRGVFYEM